MGLSIGLGYDRSSLDAGAVTRSRSAWYIPINYAFGPHKVYFDYTRANDASNTVGNTSGNQWMLGYDYALSKRTSAGVYYTKLNNNTAVPTTCSRVPATAQPGHGCRRRCPPVVLRHGPQLLIDS